MQARMKNPALVLPEALQALTALWKAVEEAGVPSATLDLINLRTSQINGCSVCVEAAFTMKKEKTDPRLYAVTAWRDMPHFTEAERAALALAEAVTRQSERTEGVSDEIWAEAARHYDEKALAALLLQIALENVWNRLNTAVRQPAGTPWS
jgi:AhpD family alkylhydroperoxidase